MKPSFDEYLANIAPTFEIPLYRNFQHLNSIMSSSSSIFGIDVDKKGESGDDKDDESEVGSYEEDEEYEEELDDGDDDVYEDKLYEEDEVDLDDGYNDSEVERESKKSKNMATFQTISEEYHDEEMYCFGVMDDVCGEIMEDYDYEEKKYYKDEDGNKEEGESIAMHGIVTEENVCIENKKTQPAVFDILHQVESLKKSGTVVSMAYSINICLNLLFSQFSFVLSFMNRSTHQLKQV